MQGGCVAEGPVNKMDLGGLTNGTFGFSLLLLLLPATAGAGLIRSGEVAFLNSVPLILFVSHFQKSGVAGQPERAE